MVKLKLSRFRRGTRFFMKKKDKNVGRGNIMNNFNGGGDGGKKKEKDPSEVQDRVRQTMKLFEQENTESDFDDITMKKKAQIALARFREEMRRQQMMDQLNNKTSLDGGDDESDGDGGGDDDSNGGGGGTNNKKGSDRDGDGNGDKYRSDRDSDGGGEMKGKNMDFMGKAGFGYRYGYHAGNENGYLVEQLQCAQEVQSSEPTCLFYNAIMIS